MALATVLAIWLAPSPRPFFDGLASRDMWAGLNRRLLPDNGWFGVIGTRFAQSPADHGAITTGALPSEPAPGAKPAAP
jgi:hypothetical protein